MRRFTRLACMLAFAATMLGAGGPALADRTRVFKDWTVTCWDRDERCAAETDITARTDRTPYNLTLSIARRNGRTTGWQASMRLRGVTPRAGSDIIIQIDDGDALAFKDGTNYGRAAGGQIMRFADSDKVARLLAAMRDGSRLYVTFMSSADRETGGDFSLRGVIASLLWMDEQQGRVGSSDIVAAAPPPPAEEPPATPAEEEEKAAADAPPPQTSPAPPAPQPAAPDTEPIKPADQAPAAAKPTAPSSTAPEPATQAPDAPERATAPQIEREEPRTDAAPGQAVTPNGIPPVTLPSPLLKKHYAESACEKLGTNLIDLRLATIAPLSPGKTLYVIPCFSGAYNIAYRLYVVRNDDFATARTLFFANYSLSLGWYGSDTLINVSYNPETGMLSAFGKGRSAGDCGNTALYHWDDYDFRMLEYRAWDRCDGSLQPDEWPVVFEVEDWAQRVR